MTTLVIAAAIFIFQNNFWVNLHQFLHREANGGAFGRAAIRAPVQRVRKRDAARSRVAGEELAAVARRVAWSA